MPNLRAMSYIPGQSISLTGSDGRTITITRAQFLAWYQAASGNASAKLTSAINSAKASIVAARVTRIANCSNAPYGTSTASGTASQPATGTLGGTNTLPGEVHAAFVLGNPTTESTWTAPFLGEADDLTWCTNYRLSTGGTPALTSTQTFTASLDGVTPSSWAGLELYLLLN